jgi:hypothetical protein
MDSSSLDTARRVLGIGAAGGPSGATVAIAGFVPETASAVRHCLPRSGAGARFTKAPTGMRRTTLAMRRPVRASAVSVGGSTACSVTP